MKFIEPKHIDCEKTDWMISKRARTIVSNYAKYTGYSESEVVNIFSENILNDENFIKWLNNQRYTKRIESILPKVFDTKEKGDSDEKVETTSQ